MAAARIAAANWGQKNRLPVIPGIAGMSGSAVGSGDGLTSPQTPSGEECKPMTTPLNLDYSTKVTSIELKFHHQPHLQLLTCLSSNFLFGNLNLNELKL